MIWAEEGRSVERAEVCAAGVGPRYASPSLHGRSSRRGDGRFVTSLGLARCLGCLKRHRPVRLGGVVWPRGCWWESVSPSSFPPTAPRSLRPITDLRLNELEYPPIPMQFRTCVRAGSREILLLRSPAKIFRS